jgi:hypothetical protein
MEVIENMFNDSEKEKLSCFSFFPTSSQSYNVAHSNFEIVDKVYLFRFKHSSALVSSFGNADELLGSGIGTYIFL